MENQMNTAADTFNAGKERVAKDIGGMVSEASELLKTYGGKHLETAKASLSQAQAVVTDTAKQYADVTDEYVHSNPWKALGIAAAAGVLVGILLSRR
jgi:ElaB/YqjD/DUF883 family membrane-anchored ribosome-binding protein